MRTLLIALALTVSVPALACGGKACGQNCAMKHATPSAKWADFDKVAAAEGTKLSFGIGGMMCGGCSSKIFGAVSQIDGVNAFAVSYETGQAKVAINPKKVDIGAICEAVSGLGYTCESAS